MKLGVRLAAAVPTDTHEVLQRAKAADRAGLDSGWLSDHLMWPKEPHYCIEAWTTMAAVAAVTDRLRLGFTMLNASFRPAAVLAKMAATLDELSKGRLIFSLGAGYYAAEYSGFGVSFLPDREDRADYVREVAAAVTALWTQSGPVTFAGRHIAFSDCHFSPQVFQKPHPPIWFGGESEHTRQAVKDLGQGWLMHLPMAEQQMQWVRSSTEFPRERVTFAALANVAIGRSRESTAETVSKAFVPNPHEKSVDAMVKWAIHGTPVDVLRRLREIEAWGIDYMVLGCADTTSIELLGSEIVPELS